MTTSKLQRQARRRTHYTGEPYTRALRLLVSDPKGLIPRATQAQANLEFKTLSLLGRSGMTGGFAWIPDGDDPFTVTWITPWRDALDIRIERTEFLPDIVEALLPRISPGSDVSGIPGLRFRFTEAGVELYRINAAGILRLVKVRKQQWWAAVAAVAHSEDYEDSIDLWYDSPARLHPFEIQDIKDELEFRDRVHAPGQMTALVNLGSGLLRRFLLFRKMPLVTQVDLWKGLGGRSIEIEWFDGPTHEQVLDYLCDPFFGLGAIQEQKPCRCANDEECYSIRLTSRNHSDAALTLRRMRDGWGSSDPNWLEPRLARRREEMSRFARSGPSALSNGRTAMSLPS
jgi:hypothetical protein